MVRAKKIFCIIAYDIKDDKRRYKVARILEKYGKRVNYSVFECMFTEKQFSMASEILNRKNRNKEESIVIYPVCVNCYTKILYYPEKKNKVQTVNYC